MRSTHSLSFSDGATYSHTADVQYSANSQYEDLQLLQRTAGHLGAGTSSQTALVEIQTVRGLQVKR